MKQINKMDNSVKLPWTIYKKPSKNENNVINEQLNENIPGMWY